MWGNVNGLLRSMAATVGVTISWLSVLALLTIPVLNVHRIACHFRPAQASRSVGRHVFLDQASESSVDETPVEEHRPGPPLLTDISNLTEPSNSINIAPLPSISRLLLRLKVGLSGRSTQDPFL